MRELFLGSIPAAAVAIATATRTKDDGDAVNTLLVSAAVGIGVLVALIFVLEAVPFVYRFTTRKTPKGSPRTLRGLGKKKTMRLLRENNPGGVHNLVTVFDVVEVRGFVRELNELFAGCGWEMDANYVWMASDGTMDVEIDLPTGGNAGLEALAELLKRAGYKVGVVPSEYDGAPEGAGSATAWIKVGEATH